MVPLGQSASAEGDIRSLAVPLRNRDDVQLDPGDALHPIIEFQNGVLDHRSGCVSCDDDKLRSALKNQDGFFVKLRIAVHHFLDDSPKKCL